MANENLPSPTTNTRLDQFYQALKEITGVDQFERIQKFMQTAMDERARRYNAFNPPKVDYLAPEVLQRTASTMFMPQVMQASNAPFQTGVNALRGLQAKSGMLESPFALASEAGLRGRQSGGAAQEAMQRAIQLGQAQSSARVAGANVINQTQPQFGIQMLQPLKDAFGTYAAYRGYTGQQQQSAYSFPWQQNQRQQFQVPNAGQYMPTTR